MNRVRLKGTSLFLKNRIRIENARVRVYIILYILLYYIFY